MDNLKPVKSNLPKVNQEDIVKLDKDALHAQFNFMLGKLKTIVDATISDHIQNKAFKDLISTVVWERYNWLLEITNTRGKIINDGTVQIS